ncbi:MAG: hypothetical protein QXU75_07145 [Candidatus Methanomethylicaceae archaeon]
MKIKILRNTVCKGQAVEAGDVIEVDERDALILIALGKAERAIEAEEKAVLPRGEKRSRKYAKTSNPTSG